MEVSDNTLPTNVNVFSYKMVKGESNVQYLSTDIELLSELFHQPSCIIHSVTGNLCTKSPFCQSITLYYHYLLIFN